MGELRWRDIFGAHRPVRSPRRVPDEARFRLGKHGASQKYHSGNDTSAVNSGSGAAQCKTLQEQRVKLLWVTGNAIWFGRDAWVVEGSEPLSLGPGLLGLFVSRLHVREAVIVGLQLLLRVG